jgi:hypothetical protein
VVSHFFTTIYPDSFTVPYLHFCFSISFFSGVSVKILVFPCSLPPVFLGLAVRKGLIISVNRPSFVLLIILVHVLNLLMTAVLRLEPKELEGALSDSDT